MTTRKNSPVQPASRARSSTAATVMATLAVIAALWWGQRFLIPLAAGLMLTILVMPLTVRLTLWLHSVVYCAVLAAVFIGLVFWGALWGIWGLFLGPALVVLIKVLAEHSRHAGRFAKLMQG